MLSGPLRNSDFFLNTVANGCLCRSRRMDTAASLRNGAARLARFQQTEGFPFTVDYGAVACRWFRSGRAKHQTTCSGAAFELLR